MVRLVARSGGREGAFGGVSRGRNCDSKNSKRRELEKFRGKLSAIAVSPLFAAQQTGQRTFGSAAEACHALVAAVKSDDEPALLSILGPDAKDLISSGDPAEDKSSREEFVKKYKEMHRLVNEPDGTTTLYIGAENWPTPIPLMHKGNAWYFDTPAGKKEVLYRRIGKNELAVIQVCLEVVDAEKGILLAAP
jgi:Protein of unknown function (DUF2950)